MRGKQRVRRTVPPLVGALCVALAVPFAAFAHSGGTEPSVALDPQQVTAGGTVVIAGMNMEPNSDRVIVMVGQQLIVQFGTVKTDANGRFSLQVTVPSHLPGAVYQVQAIGDETISADLDVIAAAGMPSAAPAAQQEVHSRPVQGIGLVLMIAVVALLVLTGGWLVMSAERIAGHRSS